MTIRELVLQGATRIKEVTDIPQKEMMMLIAEFYGKELSWVMSHYDDEIIPTEKFEEALKRRILHEPLEYILGKANFYDREFYVDARVLIPRPETELLVDRVCALVQGIKAPNIVEIGSGSGIISIMLALLIPDAKITAIDLSKDALAVAKINAQKYHVENRITFVHGSYLAGLEEPFDMLVSNPPYIADDEPLAQGLSFEPSMALYGGCIGDEMLKIILKLYHEKPIKMIACEMGYDQREPLMQFAHELGHKIEFYKDYAELDRGFWIKEKK